MKLFSRKAPACLLVATVVVSFAGLASAESIYDDAVAYWPFEGTGTTVSDESLTTAIDLDFHGTLNRVEGMVGNAIQAANGNRLTTNGDVDALDLSRDDEFTISSWINPGRLGTVIGSKMEDGPNYRGWWFFVGTTGMLDFLLRSENDADSRLWIKSEAGTIAINEWVHVAVTLSYDSEDALRGMRLYINGEELEDAVLYNDGLSTLQPTVNASSYNVFGRNDSSYGWGLVDELAIWDRALTASEIHSIAVPEPGSLALLICGLLFLIAPLSCARR